MGNNDLETGILGKTGDKKKLLIIIQEKSKDFIDLFFKNIFFVTLAVMFAGGKITANLVLGANWGNALRSGLIGLLLYGLGCCVIQILSPDRPVEAPEEYNEKKPGYLYLVLCFVVLSGAVITFDVLLDKGIINFYIPLWGHLSILWSELVQNWMQANNFIEGIGIIGFPYLLLYVFLPAIIMWRIKLKPPAFFGLKNSMAALPFVIIYAVNYIISKDLSIKNLVTLLFVIIWPALGEEFLYRGLVQRVLINVFKKPVTGIVVTSVLFAATHIPSYYFASSGSVVLTISSLLSVVLTSFFWGYGYYRTRVLWPWILIHAISDLV